MAATLKYLIEVKLSESHYYECGFIYATPVTVPRALLLSIIQLKACRALPASFNRNANSRVQLRVTL